MSELATLILAAGQGTRMKSKYPKVLHKLLGKPMLQYVVDVAKRVGSSPVIIVVGFGGEQVIEVLGSEYKFAWQKQQLGTGHAVLMAQDLLTQCTGDLLVLYGDTPLLREDTLKSLVELRRRSGAAASILTTQMINPTGYGRMIRSSNDDIIGIIEDKDASESEKLITEVNTGVYCFQIQYLLDALQRISPRNAQGEYYLTDTFALFVQQGLRVVGLLADDAEQVMGPNDRAQFAKTENYLKEKINQHLMLEGVTIVDPSHTYIGPEVRIGRDTIILPGTMILGETTIGSDCIIGPHSRIINSVVGDCTEIQYSQVLESKLGSENMIGPFAFLRPGTVSENEVKIGDFVEVKNTQISTGSKVPHLTYLGDCEVGRKVNIGAGTITCNYDGVNKYRTIIGDEAFIGSNANLVAPVEIGAGATVAAGSTITKEVPSHALGIARSRQENLTQWQSPRDRK